jgi:hypothetical protein
MSHAVDDEGPRPAHVIDYGQGLRPNRPTLGPGYDWLIELLNQSGRPLAFAMCLTAGFFQIAAPPELRLDAITFGVFMGLLGAMCGIRAAEMSLTPR